MASTLEYLATLSDERFQHIYESLAHQGFGPLDGEVAKKLKFRPQAIRKLPMGKRAKQARGIVTSTSNAELSYEVLGSYLMKERRELVTSFLDAVGIEHDEGMLTGEVDSPDDEKIPAAVEALDKDHEADDVTMYLALSAQTWPHCLEFDALWRRRAGL